MEEEPFRGAFPVFVGDDLTMSTLCRRELTRRHSIKVGPGRTPRGGASRCAIGARLVEQAKKETIR